MSSVLSCQHVVTVAELLLGCLALPLSSYPLWLACASGAQRSPTQMHSPELSALLTPCTCVGVTKDPQGKAGDGKPLGYVFHSFSQPSRAVALLQR